MNIICVVVLFFGLHLASSKLSPDAEAKFQNLMDRYADAYFRTEEEVAKRRQNFVAVDKLINQHNSEKRHSFQLGHNLMSVLSTGEKRNLLGNKARKNARNALPFDESLLPYAESERGGRYLSVSASPKSYDLRGISPCGPKIPVKHQLECGGCWAFSALSSVEWAQCVKKRGTYTVLSEQQLISCDGSNSGCNGGNIDATLDWILKNNQGVVATDQSYPYTSGQSKESGTCKKTGLTAGTKLTNWTMLPSAPKGGWSDATTAIENAIMNHGVVANCVLVNSQSNLFDNYESGVFSEEACFDLLKGTGAYMNTNHCVSLVGWGYDETLKKPYWILRNSWGTDWGIGGYMHILKGVNMCGVESQVYYTTVA